MTQGLSQQPLPPTEVEALIEAGARSMPAGYAAWLQAQPRRLCKVPLLLVLWHTTWNLGLQTKYGSRSVTCPSGQTCVLCICPWSQTVGSMVKSLLHFPPSVFLPQSSTRGKITYIFKLNRVDFFFNQGEDSFKAAFKHDSLHFHKQATCLGSQPPVQALPIERITPLGNQILQLLWAGNSSYFCLLQQHLKRSSFSEYYRKRRCCQLRTQSPGRTRCPWKSTLKRNAKRLFLAQFPAAELWGILCICWFFTMQWAAHSYKQELNKTVMKRMKY